MIIVISVCSNSRMSKETRRARDSNSVTRIRFNEILLIETRVSYQSHACAKNEMFLMLCVVLVDAQRDDVIEQSIGAGGARPWVLAVQ